MRTRLSDSLEMVGAYDRPLSLSTIVTLHSEWPRLLRPSKAMPPVIEPSPMHRDDAAIAGALRLQRSGDAVGVAEHGRRVAVLDPVVCGLGPRRVARQAAVLGVARRTRRSGR